MLSQQYFFSCSEFNAPYSFAVAPKSMFALFIYEHETVYVTAESKKNYSVDIIVKKIGLCSRCQDLDLCDIQPGKKMVHLFCVTKRTANIYSLPICILWMDIWMEQKKNGILLDLTNVAVHVDWAQKY